MRITITLEPEVEQLIRRAMRERGLSVEEAVNEAIRAGIAPPGAGADFPTHEMGEPLADITKALRRAGELEDQDVGRRLARGT